MAAASGFQPTVLPRLPSLSETIAKSKEAKRKSREEANGGGGSNGRSASASGPDKGEVIDISTSDDEGDHPTSAGSVGVRGSSPVPGLAAIAPAPGVRLSTGPAAAAAAPIAAAPVAMVAGAGGFSEMQTAWHVATAAATANAANERQKQQFLQATMQRQTEQAVRVAHAGNLSQIALQKAKEAEALQVKVR